MIYVHPKLLLITKLIGSYLKIMRLFDAPDWGRDSPLEFPVETYPAKLEGWGYRMVKIS